MKRISSIMKYFKNYVEIRIFNVVARLKLLIPLLKRQGGKGDRREAGGGVWVNKLHSICRVVCQ